MVNPLSLNYKDYISTHTTNFFLLLIKLDGFHFLTVRLQDIAYEI